MCSQGLARFAREDYSGAIDALGEAIGLSQGKDARLYLLRAKVHWTTKNYGHSTQDVMTGIEIDPKMPELKELADDLRKQSDELFVTGTDQMMKKNWVHGALRCPGAIGGPRCRPA